METSTRNKRKAHLIYLAKDAGLNVATHSPGDGATRYRFFKGLRPVSFFSDRGLYTALGISEAETWLAGYRKGR